MSYFTASFDYYATGEGLTRGVAYFTVSGTYDKDNKTVIPPTLDDARKELEKLGLGWFHRYGHIREGLHLDFEDGNGSLVPDPVKKMIEALNSGEKDRPYLQFKIEYHFNYS